MRCSNCSLPETLCVCKGAGPALDLPQLAIPTPMEVAEQAAKEYHQALDLGHFRRFAGLNESERQGELLGLAKQLAGQGDAVVKALQKDQKSSALRAMMLLAVSMKKLALAYAMDPVADAAEKLADELDKASRSS